ncbi:MAG: hypothetical protein KC609_25110 [Myxococcales bacterium]|nr:hypothetical protein [Myxococcales bacterium]
MIQRLQENDLARFRDAVAEHRRQLAVAAELVQRARLDESRRDGWSIEDDPAASERWSLGDPTIAAEQDPSWVDEAPLSRHSGTTRGSAGRFGAFLAGTLFGALLTLGGGWVYLNFDALSARFLGSDVSEPVVEGMRRGAHGPQMPTIVSLDYLYAIPRVGESRRRRIVRRNPDEGTKLATNGSRTPKLDKTSPKEKKSRKVVKKKKRSKDPKHPASLDEILREYQRSHNRGQTPMTP